MRILIQPYYFWNGHYKNYTESLIRSNSICIISSTFKKSKNILSVEPVIKNYEKNILNFTLSRILNCLLVILQLRSFIFKKSYFHFLEFEPFSKIIFLTFNIFLRKKVIFTIHSTSVSKSNSIIIGFIKVIQRLLFIFAILLSNFSPCKIVVHNNFNKKFLQFFTFSKRIFVIEYPCDVPIYKKKYIKANNLLVFGQFREDKGIIDILKKYDLSKFKITFAGKFYDKKLLKFLKRKKNFKIFNKFISERYLVSLAKKNKYFLIPYNNFYSGSAGPMKKSLSLGCPVITTFNKTFYNVVKLKKLGFFINDDIYKNLININKKEYLRLSNKCIEFAQKNNWMNFFEKYEKVYKS